MDYPAMPTITICTLDGAKVPLMPDGVCRSELLLEMCPCSSQSTAAESAIVLSLPFYEKELKYWIDAWSDDKSCRSFAACAAAVKAWPISLSSTLNHLPCKSHF